jgi:hypothetical protein
MASRLAQMSDLLASNLLDRRLSYSRLTAGRHARTLLDGGQFT